MLELEETRDSSRRKHRKQTHAECVPGQRVGAVRAAPSRFVLEHDSERYDEEDGKRSSTGKRWTAIESYYENGPIIPHERASGQIKGRCSANTALSARGWQTCADMSLASTSCS